MTDLRRFIQETTGTCKRCISKCLMIYLEQLKTDHTNIHIQAGTCYFGHLVYVTDDGFKI